jgi:pimeloyl-ACP methyl ester carboxylesterase
MIYCDDRGAGARPLVLLHGFCETREIWNGLAHQLAPKYRVLTPDLPGFGSSDALPDGFDLDAVAAALWQWIDNMQLKLPVVVGHSLGGYVALAMAEQKNKALGGLGLFHSTAAADLPEKKENRNKVIDFVKRNGVDPFIDSFVPTLFAQPNHPAMAVAEKICRATRQDTLLAYTAAMRDRPERLALLAALELPVLIIAGAQDTIVPLAALQKQAETLKNGHIEVLEGTGHMGMLEAPDQAARALDRFMAAR